MKTILRPIFAQSPAFGEDPPVPNDLSLRQSYGITINPADYIESGWFSFDSRFVKSIAIDLMVMSWNQVPAGSLPNDAGKLAYMIGERLSKNMVHGLSDALRDWFLCSDGRLYHPMVAHLALERKRRFSERQAVWERRTGQAAVTPMQPPPPRPRKRGDP